MTEENKPNAKPTNTVPSPNAFLNRKKLLEHLRKEGGYAEYLSLNEEFRNLFHRFLEGKATLPLTYDPVFKTLMSPEVHPGRLSNFISSIIGQEAEVLCVLPTESIISLGESMLVMDILVKLSDGSLVNVEIQKCPYYFTAERLSCYSADLLMRQYTLVKGAMGKDFHYSEIHKVYTIVIYEESTDEFKKTGGSYLHRGKTVFDTGLELEMIQEYYLIALDVFRKEAYNLENNNLAGWLKLLSAGNFDELTEAVERFPWLSEVAEEIRSYLHRPGEVARMFSEALRILDENTLKYMVDDLQGKVDELAEKNNNLACEITTLSEQNKNLTEENAEMAKTLEELRAENERLKHLNKNE